MFVYGTLQRTGRNHHLIEEPNATFLGPARTLFQFPLVVQGLPFLLPVAGLGHQVSGELYLVPGRTLRWVDALEGHPHLYERSETHVSLLSDNGRLLTAWTYFFPRFGDDMLRGPFLSQYQPGGRPAPAIEL